MGNIGSGMKIEQVKDPEKGREVQIKLEKGNRTRKPQESSYHMLNQEWIFKVFKEVGSSVQSYSRGHPQGSLS